MTHDFYENGERLLKDTRADVALAHSRIERMQRQRIIELIGETIVVLTMLSLVALSLSKPECRCQRPVSDVRFVEWSVR